MIPSHVSSGPRPSSLGSAERGSHRRILIALLVFAACIIVGSVGYYIIEPNYDVLEAVYMTVITVTTVGLAEIGGELTPGGRLWTMFVIAAGLTSGAVLLSLVVGTVVEGRLRSILGRRQLEQKISSLSGHVIVCGYGRMGSRVAAELREGGREVVVIDNEPGRTTVAEQEGLLYLLGDAQEEEVLRAAGIARARALVACLPDDAGNVFLTLSARGLSSSVRIIARAQEASTQDKLLKAGASRVVCPEIIGASRVVDVLLRPAIVDFVEIAHKGVDLEMDEWTLEPGSRLAGRSLRELALPARAGAMVVAVRRPDGSAVYNPGPEFTLAEGETVILIGKRGMAAAIEGLAGLAPAED